MTVPRELLRMPLVVRLQRGLAKSALSLVTTIADQFMALAATVAAAAFHV